MKDLVDAGTTEVLRARLTGTAAELARRARTLDGLRRAEFGATSLELVEAGHISTGHRCTARDVVQIGGHLLFGVTGGPADGDLLSLHAMPGFAARDASAVPGLLDDPRFRRDFAELRRYYRDAVLLRLRRTAGRLLAVFRVGEKVTDIRVLRWNVAPDGSVTYLDARGDRDHVFPPPHDFPWREAVREDHVPGRHPHIRIADGVYVAATGGALTVKTVDDTATDAGVIHREPVDDPLQSLADAEVASARVGPLVLLRVRPYNEPVTRYLVVDTTTKDVVRLDGIGRACRTLPDGQGIIFPGGYHLATGGVRVFGDGAGPEPAAGAPAGDRNRTPGQQPGAGPEFEEVVRSPNGEDVLYVFRDRADGRTLLLPYNLIRKEVATPVRAGGYALFDDGTLVVPRGEAGEPGRVHPLQVWRTPFTSDTYAAARTAAGGPLARIGNADLVRAISDCLTVVRMAEGTEASAEVYEALLAACARTTDRYHWLGDGVLGTPGGLREPLAGIAETARAALAGFAQEQELARHAAESVEEAAARIVPLVRRARGEAAASAAEWVRRLGELRAAQGRVETLRELPHADPERLDELSAALTDGLTAAATRAVAFLARDDAFAPFHDRIDRLAGDAGNLTRAAEAAPLAEALDGQTADLTTVTDVVGSLEFADATVRTTILQRVAGVLAAVNRARAVLDGRRRALLDTEARAGFAARFALLGQAVTGALATARTPEACDEQLTRVLLRIEELEAGVAESDDLLAEVAAKRDDVHEAFSARRRELLDERARRVTRLTGSAERVLATVDRRAAALAGPEEIATYFATDPLVAKIRSTAGELRALGEPARAEELGTRLAAARREAARAVRDRRDLYDADGGTVRIGRHRFAVAPGPFEVTLLPGPDGAGGTDGTGGPEGASGAGGQSGPVFAVSGTGYRRTPRDAEIAAPPGFWDQPLVSESPEVYRAEHLAATVFADLRDGDDPLPAVREAAAAAYDEGYENGVHDFDAAAILTALLPLAAGAGTLRHEPGIRARAQVFWAFGTTEPERAAWTRRARSLARARDTFGDAAAVSGLCAELGAAVSAFDGGPGGPVGDYLFDELADGTDAFVTGGIARDFVAKFRSAVGGTSYADDLAALEDDPAARRHLVEAWLGAYRTAAGPDPDDAVTDGDFAEAVALELCPALSRYDVHAPLTARVEGLLGTHPRIHGGVMDLRLDEFLARTGEFRAVRVPAYRAFRRRRDELVAAERERLRLDAYRPRVPGAFVRNRLIDEVYLPLIGDNLARQIGTADDARGTDRHGLLMLISPPGYGKTTLVEYVASRLGMLLVKVDGPALGSEVTSLDPAQAPDATARREVEKINFALEAGSSTLLYLDDIQHTSPRLLERFLPLCDATRRIEGVRDGRPHTFDLCGKRFAVVMAGNPYTGGGAAFEVPGMLANRADVWNLGDVLSGRDEAFALSFIENALTSNPVLAPLAGRERAEVEALVRVASGDPAARLDTAATGLSGVESERVLAVLRALLRIRTVVLTVGRAYLGSAARTDASRTEPPFLLQGSYRDMNRLAGKVLPTMNDAEIDALVDDHYTGEARLLASAAEANLLRLAELRGTLTPDQAARWAEVKAAYRRTVTAGPADADPVTRAVTALTVLAERVAAVEAAITRASSGADGHPNAGTGGPAV